VSPLFPAAPGPGLVGIARLAASAPPLETKRGVEYRELPTRSYLSRLSSRRVPFDWTLNPYRGCEFACKYCYARYTHEFMELREPELFETRIFAKRWSAAAFRDDVRRLPPGAWVAIGTATDPYQPAERRFRITRKMLEVLAATHGLRIGITTKSDLIVRDADLLAEVARRHRTGVMLTVTTLDAGLARLLEPKAPRPDLRLGAIRTLSRAGVPVGAFVAPVLPLLNDSEASLDQVARAAADHGARYFAANLLFLRPPASNFFFAFLEREFPHLARRYRDRFARSAYLTGAYAEQVRDRVRLVRERHGLARELGSSPVVPGEQQLPLF
jgi:DNA repair photolyase